MSSRKQTIEEILGDIASLWRGVIAGHKPPFSDELHVTFAQGQILHIIGHHEGIGIKDLADHMGITPSGATQLVDSLVENDLLIRQNDEIDRRSIRIILSPKSRDLIRRLQQKKLQKFAEFFSVLSDNELATFKELSQKIASAINKK